VYFNAWSFWRWFFYAIWQGSLLLLVSLSTLSTGSSHNGENGSLYVDGQFIFGTVVIIVNIKILINSFEYTPHFIFLVVLSIMLFFIGFWFLSSIQDYYLFGVFSHVYDQIESYLLMFFLCASFILVDYGQFTVMQEIQSFRTQELEIND
jgi:hypothetical protein